MRRQVTSFALAALGGGLLAVACGAGNLEAPAAEVPADIQQCRSFEQLMPNFVAAIDQGRTQNLKAVVEQQLLKPLRDGDSPPVADVLRAIFTTLTEYASAPPEIGAKSGQYCADPPPPLSQANKLCEMRRALAVLVHDGKGIDAINLLDPQLTILLNYLTGTGVDCQGKPRKLSEAHYEVSNLFSRMCAQDANCKLGNGLDLIDGLTAYVQTTPGKKLVADLNVLAKKQSLLDQLKPSNLSEDQAVALVKGLIPVIQSADSASLKSTFNNLPLSASLKMDLQPIIDDLVDVLNHPEITTPTHNALNCLIVKDTNYDLARMVYRLAVAEQCPEFGLTKLTDTLQGLETVDSRGSLVYVANVLSSSIRADDTAVDSAALVCKTLFSNTGNPSNAQLVLPVITDLVEHHVINEAICAGDTLIFGCAGGNQPACQ
jgi:hypothetical protein